MKLIAASIALLLITQSSWDVDPVMQRLDAYLADYEPKLSELIADELMTQQMPSAAVTLLRSRMIAPKLRESKRRIESEVAFIALPNGGWLGFRHVKSVNGVKVHESDASLAGVLQKSS